jgi:hypothetical protein
LMITGNRRERAKGGVPGWPLLVALLTFASTACSTTHSGDTGDSDDTGGSGDTAPSVPSGIDVTLHVDDSALLPAGGEALFDVWAGEDFTDHEAWGVVTVGGTVAVDVGKGSWGVWARFTWQDPDKVGTEGYWVTACAGDVHVEVPASTRIGATVVAGCADEGGSD